MKEKTLLLLALLPLIAGTLLWLASKPYEHFGIDASFGFFIWLPLISCFGWLIVSLMTAPLLRLGKDRK